jgi:signal transduction histidine kinase
MERLANELLRLARLDAGQEPVARTEFLLRPLFEGVGGDLAGSLAAKEQQLHIDLAPDAWHAYADAGHVHDIFRNLVENAITHSPIGADIRISATRRDSSIIIAISDEGPGIPPAEWTRVFERFYRVDKSRSGPGGTGLGLAIVKHLAELHGGTVTAANGESGGAVFTVVLPFQPRPTTGS